MICPECKKENPDSKFCIECGAELDLDKDYSLEELKNQVQSLRLEVREIHSVIRGYETGPEVIQPRKYTNRKKTSNGLKIPGWELLLGGNWLAIIGVIAVFIGTAFFLKLAFENDWINQTNRILLGVFVGVVFLAIGEIWRNKYASYFNIITGCGIAILYLTIFSAYALYSMIGYYFAVAFLLVATILAVLQALRNNSITLAVLGVVGAFAAPFVLLAFDGIDFMQGSIGSVDWLLYIILIDLGVIFLATFRNWSWFTFIALIGSLLSYAVWATENFDNVSLLVSQGGISVIFLLILGSTTLFNYLWKRPAKGFDYSLILINSAAFLFITYMNMWDSHREWLGALTIVIAGLYASLSYISYRSRLQNNDFSTFLLGISAVFLGIAFPVHFQYDAPIVLIAWSIEGLILTWLSIRMNVWQIRFYAIFTYSVMIVSLTVFFTSIDLENFAPILNSRFATFATAIFSMYASFYLIRQKMILDPGSLRVFFFRSSMIRIEKLAAGLLIAANFLTIWILSAEIISVVDSDLVNLNNEVGNYVKSLSLSLLWAVYASIILISGIVFKLPKFRVSGLLLLAIPVIKLFLYDTFQLDQIYRVVAYFSLGAILLLGGLLYQRFNSHIKEYLLKP
tara:strand:- start:6919 stop:8793 length:1875 start_codon:yes stop_codon:yes gene_type:complete